MASLDELEGDAVETLALGILIAIVVVFWYLWKQFGSFPGMDPFKLFQQAIAAVLNRLKNLWQGAKTSLPTMGTTGASGPDAIAIGGTGVWTAQSEADYQTELSQAFLGGQMDLAEYQQLSAPASGGA